MFDLGSFLPFSRSPRNMSKIYSLRRSCRVVGPIRNMNIDVYIYMYIIYTPICIYNTWATVNIWYIAPSHQFLKSVLSFFRFWYISKCYRFLKGVLSFSKPQLKFKKIKMFRILLSIKLNFGCSSHRN
jgi:hypothetical protein